MPRTNILIDKVTQVDDIVYRIFASGIAERSKEAEVVVGARVDSQTDRRCIIISVRSRLSSTNWARVCRIADSELIVVLCEWLEVRCLDLKIV